MTRKEFILMTVEDSVKDLLNYEDLEVKELKQAIDNKEISIEEIAAQFAYCLKIELSR